MEFLTLKRIFLTECMTNNIRVDSRSDGNNNRRLYEFYREHDGNGMRVSLPNNGRNSGDFEISYYGREGGQPINYVLRVEGYKMKDLSGIKFPYVAESGRTSYLSPSALDDCLKMLSDEGCNSMLKVHRTDLTNIFTKLRKDAYKAVKKESPIRIRKTARG